jgi:rhodanese-related sulfurtransferase
VASLQRPRAPNGKPPGLDPVRGPRPRHSRSAIDAGGDWRSLDRLIDEAAEQITRFSAPEACSAATDDGIIIDIRSRDARDVHGIVPGSVHIPRTVLEWRIALDSPWRNQHLGGLDQRLILICDHGYSSILAASTLVQLGFARAGDVIGGFESWRDSRLPIAPCRDRPGSVGALPGTGPPD